MRGLSQHVIQRGNNRSTLFRCPFDYRFFLDLLRCNAGRCGVEVHGYVLMTNHVHILCTPSTESSLPEMMQRIGRVYVPFFNRTYARTGSLWEGRYRASVIQDEKYWMTCLRYIELNPVRAGVVNAPDLHEWSSYRAHALGFDDSLLTPHPLFVATGSSAPERQRAWRATCATAIEGESLTRIRRSIQSCRPLNPAD